jgi:heptosyltransferase-2
LRRSSAKLRHPPVSTIDGYLRVAEAAGCTIDSRQLELATTTADEQAANRVWHELGLPAGDRVILLNSGGAYGAAKHWPAEHFAELARRIVRSGEFFVLVNCGPQERRIAQAIAAEAAHPRVVSLAHLEQLPIGLTKACVRRSRLVVSTDSGPRLMAIAFGKPVITLFGPTDPAATATYYDRETCLALGLDCQPCMARVCPLGHHRCLRELTVDYVHSAVERVVADTSNELVTEVTSATSVGSCRVAVA